MGEIMWPILVFVLLGYIVWREIFTQQEREAHKEERKDLYDRIMAGDYEQYYTHQPENEPLPGRNVVRAGLKRSLDAMEAERMEQISKQATKGG